MAVLLRRPYQPQALVRAIVLCAMASFLFGWHVHEKAVLMIIIPMTYVNRHTALSGRKPATSAVLTLVVGRTMMARPTTDDNPPAHTDELDRINIIMLETRKSLRCDSGRLGVVQLPSLLILA